MKKKEFKLSDACIGRVINIIQESMISGIDILDLFREMRMKPADGDSHELVLTEEYTKKVDEWHEQIEQDLKARKDFVDNNQSGHAFITGTGNVDKVGGIIQFDPKMVTKKDN